MISIHALREEGDTAPVWRGSKVIRFLSTPSARRATDLPVDCHGSRDISIHALREEGDLPHRVDLQSMRHFYPRPPRGGRRDGRYRCGRAKHISIHALREEGDQSGILCCRGGQIFLSTPSARRATDVLCIATGKISDFYPRPPRGGRPLVACGGVDVDVFLSTPSARRATAGGVWWG